MKIQKANLDDIDSIISMQLDLASEGVIYGYVADMAKEWNERDLEWVYLSMNEGNAVGFIYCADRPYEGECIFPANSQILEIIELYVCPAFRHRGIGKQLLNTIISKANSQGYSHLRLYSAAKRFDDILTFYRDCGFTPWYLEMTQTIGNEQGEMIGDSCILC